MKISLFKLIYRVIFDIEYPYFVLKYGQLYLKVKLFSQKLKIDFQGQLPRSISYESTSARCAWRRSRKSAFGLDSVPIPAQFGRSRTPARISHPITLLPPSVYRAPQNRNSEFRQVRVRSYFMRKYAAKFAI